jgi:hypothetical protein
MYISKIILALITGLFLVTSVFAAVPQLISYQGRLTDASGDPVTNGDYLFTFAIYNDMNHTLWSSGTGVSLAVTNGLFNVYLGESPMDPLPDSLFTGDHDLYLGITVENDPEITPRVRLTPAPFSMTALSVASSAITNEMIADSSIGFEKLADNDGQPGDIVAYVETKAGGSWTPTPYDELYRTTYPAGWVDDGDVVRLGNGGDLVGVGTILPEARLHAYAHTDYDIVDPMHVSLNDPSPETDYNTRLAVDINGNVGVGLADPLAVLHVRSNDLQLQSASAFQSDVLVVEGPDAVMGLYSNNGGSVGSAIYLSELNGDGSLNNKWGIFRLTTPSGSDIKFTYGTNKNAANNPEKMRLTTAGRAICHSLEITSGADLSEPFGISTREELPAGAVVVIDSDNPGMLTISHQPYDRRVAGVVSGAGGVEPGITLSHQTICDNGRNVAIAGRVYCLADASFGAIQPGDLLTTSSNPGHAMIASDRSRAYGTVIGKAMTPLNEGTGLVLVLINLQ